MTTTLDFTVEPRTETTDRSITYGWPVGWRRWTSPRDDDPRDVYQVWATLTIRHSSDYRRYTADLSYQEEQAHAGGKMVSFSLAEKAAKTVRLLVEPASRFSAKTLQRHATEQLAALRGCQDTDQIMEFRTALAGTCNTEAPAC